MEMISRNLIVSLLVILVSSPSKLATATLLFLLSRLPRTVQWEKAQRNLEKGCFILISSMKIQILKRSSYPTKSLDLHALMSLVFSSVSDTRGWEFSSKKSIEYVLCLWITIIIHFPQSKWGVGVQGSERLL
ncbi:hypothetical protein EDC94DRAFT_671150 [Helicostylum pulchrum]|nr:hypothetical protein EDC94DRAFT_671150 [Helicostylum pulchrum]